MAESERRTAAADWKDFVHTGPGTLAGRYMRRFWQPVYLAEDLRPGRAVPIRIMSEDFTLYRGEGGLAHTAELNLEPSEGATLFAEAHYGPATEVVPAYVDKVLSQGW